MAGVQLSLKAAYDRGWRSSLTDSDWDEAADRFDRNWGTTQELRVAWMDGWSDRQQGHRKGHALRCPLGLTLGYNGNNHGHENCEWEP